MPTLPPSRRGVPFSTSLSYRGVGAARFPPVLTMTFPWEKIRYVA